MERRPLVCRESTTAVRTGRSAELDVHRLVPTGSIPGVPDLPRAGEFRAGTRAEALTAP
ncbi:hypothetical protein GCM10010254_62280 [Streptomyces chromofuscus]|nr:hypothetical protein GCM10010254_62280 [Streptomyces chromofuscus]